MQSVLKKYCNENIKAKIINDYSQEDWLKSFLTMKNDEIKEFIYNKYDNVEVVIRDVKAGGKYELNWHLDDKILIKHPRGKSNLNIIYTNDKHEFWL